jgi:hypothetical protein
MNRINQINQINKTNQFEDTAHPARRDRYSHVDGFLILPIGERENRKFPIKTQTS